MKDKKSNISFSLLSLSIFLFFTFTFSSHGFSLPNSKAVLENTATSKHAKISSNKNDSSSNSFIGEVEEVEESENEDHSVDYHLAIVFSFFSSIIHTQESNNTLLSNYHLHFNLSSAPLFIKNCTFLI